MQNTEKTKKKMQKNRFYIVFVLTFVGLCGIFNIER